MTVDALSRLYAPYKIYPLSHFDISSPVRKFQESFPGDHYARDVEQFLRHHNYEPDRRGADLPWWGKRYFTTEAGKRVFVIGQDSKWANAGSVVFWVHLFRYEGGIKRIRQCFIDKWGLNLDFTFVTDAAKVYTKGSWNDRDFDRAGSRALLEAEIDLCEPDLLILLGGAPLRLLQKGLAYSSVVDAGRPIQIASREAIVAPFPIGKGPAQPNFADRMQKATKLIRASLHV